MKSKCACLRWCEYKKKKDEKIIGQARIGKGTSFGARKGT